MLDNFFNWSVHRLALALISSFVRLKLDIYNDMKIIHLLQLR